MFFRRGDQVKCLLAESPLAAMEGDNKSQDTVTRNGKKVKIRVEGRHDPCVAPRAVPIAEAMVALTLIDHLMRNEHSRL